MMKSLGMTGGLLAMLALTSCSAAAVRAPERSETQRYTFSRLFRPGSEQEPRGGTTKGPPVTVARQPSGAWKALGEPGLTKQERDRRAILAMAGDYRTTFEFIETIPLAFDYSLARPYQSWATERVYVTADEPDFVRLQHVMVMYYLEDEAIKGPVVIKHWRQDWTYEPRSFHEYGGRGFWRRRRPSELERQGAWSQEVFHVDDSPRYASLGRWKHTDGFSVWAGSQTFRPLPRREYSARSDYDVLEAVNRHIVLPTGWVHEQENLKRVLGEGAGAHYRARELGLNRYDRIVDFDFSAGDEYWRRTKDYWRIVRAVWERIFANSETVRFQGTVDGANLIGKHFGYAETLGGDESAETLKLRAREYIAPHVE